MLLPLGCCLGLFFVFDWTLVAAEERAEDESWGNKCPTACSCHLGHFADLPINQWLQKGEIKTDEVPISLNNEVYYEEVDTHDHLSLFSDRGELLKIVMCIFQSTHDPKKLLSNIPSDTQALTLLQSRGSEEISLEIQHMKRFQDLIYLDVQGFCPEVWKEESHEHTAEHNFTLYNDVLKSLGSLQYLSLQHVKLLGSSIQSNEIDHEGYAPIQLESHQNDIPINLPGHIDGKLRRNIKSIAHNIVVLQPNSEREEPVSYQVYKEQQEKARLSIFARLSNLVLLRVVDCGLHEVYWEMFEGLRKLEYLSLEKNQLLFLPEFAFYGAPNLKMLSLAHNKLLNIHSTGLAGLLDLQVLDLSYNNFSHLSEFSLPPFPKLTEAYFWHNPIEAVFASTFEIMNATTVLYLGGNNSSLTLHPNSFQGLNQLKKLVLYNVGIEVLERELLRGMPQLQYLKLSGKITSISFDAFLDAPLVETLILQYCNIRAVSMDAFYGLHRLAVLDLSNNLLETLPPGIFDQQFSLRELYLQNNSLTELPDGFFINLSAKMIRLEGNLWHCTCDMKGWLATATNRVKAVKTERKNCDNDKRIGCATSHQVTSYIYEKKVSPRCETPSEYKGWGVYHVLRRELRCSKPAYKNFKRKEYLKKKYRVFDRSNHNNDKQSTSNIVETNTQKRKILLNIHKETNLNHRENTKNTNSLKSSELNHELTHVPTTHSLPFIPEVNATSETMKTTTENGTNTLLTSYKENVENSVPLLHGKIVNNSKQLKNEFQFSLQHYLNSVNSAIKRKTETELTQQSVNRITNFGNIQDKFYKKLLKTELHRKHQEKMRNKISA